MGDDGDGGLEGREEAWQVNSLDIEATRIGAAASDRGAAGADAGGAFPTVLAHSPAVFCGTCTCLHRFALLESMHHHPTSARAYLFYRLLRICIYGYL